MNSLPGDRCDLPADPLHASALPQEIPHCFLFFPCFFFFLMEEESDREMNRVREKDGDVSNGYKVWFSYSFVKNVAKDRRKQRCTVQVFPGAVWSCTVDVKIIKALLLWQQHRSNHSTGQIQVLGCIMKVKWSSCAQRSKIWLLCLAVDIG